MFKQVAHPVMALPHFGKYNPATVKLGNVSWSSQNMNSHFTVTPCKHSSKCGTKWKLHHSVVSPLQAEPTKSSWEMINLCNLVSQIEYKINLVKKQPGEYNLISSCCYPHIDSKFMQKILSQNLTWKKSLFPMGRPNKRRRQFLCQVWGRIYELA
jgi:hypothetical protein